MKRFWMMLLTISVVLVIALPAGVAKPGKGPKPPKAVPIAVSLDANPVWVHEGADLISYTVTLENKTSTDIDGIRVDLSAAKLTIEIWTGSIGPNESVALDGGSRSVEDFAEFDDCFVGDECPLPASAEVFIGEDLLTQVTMSTPLMPYLPCNFIEDPVDGVCIWTPPQTGVWKITLAPTPPDNPKRAISAGVTVRDGVPGNWCTLADPDSTFTGKWREGDGAVFGWVYLPGAENVPALDDGMCLHGGAGGEYFAVGNPDSFYLSANGVVTVQWKRLLP